LKEWFFAPSFTKPWFRNVGNKNLKQGHKVVGIVAPEASKYGQLRPIQYYLNDQGLSAMRAILTALLLTNATQAGAECGKLCDLDW
jgi:hypothetical protein